MQPTSTIIANLGLEPNGRVKRFFTNTCYRYMDKYVPQDNGDLRTVVDIGSDTITYEMPYARYQYYGVREDGTHKVSNYTTPGTGPYWDKRMVSAEMNDVIEEVQEYVNRGK
jgi:hypothetical protein